MKKSDMTCINCIYFYHNEDHVSTCRKSPPVHQGLQSEPCGWFPEVSPDIWCGEGAWRVTGIHTGPDGIVTTYPDLIHRDDPPMTKTRMITRYDPTKGIPPT